MSARSVLPVRSTSQRRSATRRSERRASLGSVVIALVWLVPVYWMVKSAFEADQSLLASPPHLVIHEGTLSHFRQVLSDPGFWAAMRMSLTVALVTVVFATTLALLFSFSLSRYRFRGRMAMIVAVLVVQMVPAEALFISQYQMLNSVNLLNSPIGLAALYIGTHVPFITWMMRGYVDAVPVDLEEAAQIDGCSRLGAFFRITLPLLLPGIVATSVFAFLFAWNEYTLALIVLSRNTSVTLPIWLQSFQASDLGYTDWGGVMAGATLMAVPVIIMFVIIQKRLGQSTVGGAVKG
nr:carbohydrate ABC transporter permease [Actinomyces sp.]